MQTKKHKFQDGREDNQFEQLVSKYIPYWPAFLLSIVLGISVSYIYLRYTTPIYEANATLIIKDERKGNEESKLVESLDQISSKKIVENEIEILQSRKVMLDVIKSLGLYAQIYEQGDILNTLLYNRYPISILAENPDTLKSSDKINILYDSVKQQITLNEQLHYPLNQVVATPFGKLKFILNPDYVPGTLNSKPIYFTLSPPRNLVGSFLGSLKVEAASKLSSVVDLSFRDESRTRAESVLNHLISAYQQSANDEKDALASNTLKFVTDRLKIVTHDLDSIEKKIQQYKSGNRAVDISAQGQLFLQNVSANDQKLGDVNTQLAVLDQVENFVKSKGAISGGIVPSTLGISDPVLNQLIDKLYTSELEYDNLKKTVGENNPALVAIADRINKIKPSIVENIRSQRQSLMATRQNITTTNGGYNSILQTVPQKERELLDISREQQIKSNLYAFLLQKREESEIAYASAVSNSRVVDYAQAGMDPVSPKKMLITLIVVFIFMGICTAIIFIRESFTGKILYRQEVESRTSIPIIGEVAFDKSKENIVIEKGRRSFIAEEFRKLRISLSFLGIDAAHKKILVTSSISGEGKSFIAANLAISLALTGKSVVLVDLDLNNPTQNKILNVTREKGVTEILQGECSAHDVISHVKGHENLYFISAGQLPENPSELLSNGKIKELLDYLDHTFDMVVIDTSPLVLVTDGYILTGLCDATLYVIRHKYTPKMLIKRIDENNHINPINNPAIVFNGVKMRGFFKNNYGYGYDYVYGNKERAKENKKLVAKY